jgi:hypothetical protein
MATRQNKKKFLWKAPLQGGAFVCPEAIEAFGAAGN